MTTRLESIAPSLLVLASLLWLGLGSHRRVAAADRPYGPLHKTRSAVFARQGMAATSQPLATAAAIRVLQKDGNAVLGSRSQRGARGRRANVLRLGRRLVRDRLGCPVPQALRTQCERPITRGGSAWPCSARGGSRRSLCKAR